MQIEEVGGECSIKCSDMHQWLDLFLMQKKTKTNKKQKKNSGLGREEQKPITKTKKKKQKTFKNK